MSEIYYALIIIPILFILVMGFIFQSSVAEIEEKQERLDCPYPAISGLWNDTGTIRYTNFTYNYEAVGLPTKTLTCTEVHTMDGFDYCYGCPTTSFAGSMFFLGDWLSELFVNKIPAGIEMIALFINAPAEVLNLPWYAYVNVFLLFLVVLGGIMVFRG